MQRQFLVLYPYWIGIIDKFGYQCFSWNKSAEIFSTDIERSSTMINLPLHFECRHVIFSHDIIRIERCHLETRIVFYMLERKFFDSWHLILKLKGIAIPVYFVHFSNHYIWMKTAVITNIIGECNKIDFRLDRSVFSLASFCLFISERLEIHFFRTWKCRLSNWLFNQFHLGGIIA